MIKKYLFLSRKLGETDMRRRDNLAHAYAQSRIMQIAKNE
jgi:hypothetical protein